MGTSWAKVIITGESAGGFNVTSLLLSEYAKGLFSHAISQSGGTRLSDVSEGDASAEVILNQLIEIEGNGEASAMTSAEIREYLLSLSDREFLSSLSTGLTGMTGTPAIFTDGAVIPADGYNAFETGNYPNNVPVILGANKEEVKLFFSLSRSLSWKTDLYQAAGLYSSMLWKADAVDTAARNLSSHEDQPAVYTYRFDWGSINEKGESPLPGKWGAKLGAAHTFEIPFFLGTDSLNGPLYTSRLFTRGNREARKLLSGVMMDYVSSFVRSGDPNPPGANGTRPRWEPWSNELGEPKGIVFDVDGGNLNVRMTSEEITRDSIDQSMKKNLSAELYRQTKAYLDR